MGFAEQMRSYLRESGASATELAEVAGISKSSLSRYLSGKRVPDSQGDVPGQLARGLAELSAMRVGETLNAEDVQKALVIAAEGEEAYPSFPDRLGNVLDTFGVAHNRLARSMGFDPSYISRILAGKRRPADMPRFVDDVAAYVARNYGDARKFMV